MHYEKEFAKKAVLSEEVVRRITEDYEVIEKRLDSLVRAGEVSGVDAAKVQGSLVTVFIKMAGHHLPEP